MDNTQSSVGCRSGKTILVNPNKFENQGFYDNMSVPLEDLNIFVQLETTKRARTVLINDGVSFSQNTKGVKVKFIEGTDVSGRKVLTTKYTDLTTSFDNDEENFDNESLGITSVDISFDSSYAPRVVINFVDLRGSSIFQNESMLKSGNKYATLFQLPYPIFKLTVKGYYGLPVQYDLHMVKFNAKFNSKTGNFEITAEFIGYTYAMFSDMLIGYLRAIEYTSLGKKKYEDLKKDRPNLMTLDGLIKAVSNIDTNIEKLASTDVDLISYNIYNTQIEKLSYIKNNILVLGSELDVLSDLSEYRFIRPKNINTEEYVKIVNPYNENVKGEVENFNNGSDIKFNTEEFNFSNAKLYQGLNIDILRDDSKREELSTNQLKDADNIDDLIPELIEYANKNEISGDFNVYDLRSFYLKLSNKETELNEIIKTKKIDVGEKIRDRIKEVLLGLDPTVRNIIEIFTVSVEVFMSVLFDVSLEAIKSPVRTKELSKFTPNESFDYKNGDVFYPWPEYRQKDDKYGLVEEYLGNASGLNKYNITELTFIDDLHKAFLESSKAIDEAKITEEKNESTWVSTNPLDTPLFISEYPYSRFNTADKNTLLNVLLSRAFIYMGLSNYKLKPEEIQKYADAEAKLLLLESDESLKRVLVNITKDNIISSKANINNTLTDVAKLEGDNYVYNYMFGGENKTLSLIPLNKPVNSAQSKNFEYNLESSTESLTGYSADGGIFFTNYTTSSAYEGVKYTQYNSKVQVNANITENKNEKSYNGSDYLKIIFPNTYEKTAPNSLQSGLIPTENVLSLETLSKGLDEFRELTLSSDVGFNQFGGLYGIQEFKYLNFNIEGLEKAPFRLMFYADGIEDNSLQGVMTSVRNRDTNGQFKKTKYDLNSSPILSIYDKDDLNESDFQPITVRTETGSQIGQNRIYLSEQINTKLFEYTYPYVSYVVDEYNIGLFGSRLYYEQKTDEAKAFLFLHNFPWNGLTDTFIYGGVFHKNEILNTFANRAGFISVPYLWAAFIGGLIWRLESDTDPIVFHNGSESFIPTLDATEPTDFPNKRQYLCLGEKPTNSMIFESGGKYKIVDEVIVQLPEQVKKEFVNIFKLFVNKSSGDSDWQILKRKLEIFNGTGSEFVQKWNQTFTIDSGNLILANTNIISTNDYNINPSAIQSMFNPLISNYNIITTYNPFDEAKYNFFTELKDKSDGVYFLMYLLTAELIVSNFTYKIWDNETIRNDENLSSENSNIAVSSEDMNIFLDQIITNLSSEAEVGKDKTNQKENEIFGTDKDILIKQLLYRTCKNIYDKWIAGTQSEENLIFRDGPQSRNPIDFELAKYRAANSDQPYSDNKPKLIDSFRFVNRSFRDVGNRLFVNPKQVVDSLINNPNISFYDSVTSLLSTNKFNFIALPNYINYNDEESLKTIFKPSIDKEDFTGITSGPAFVCVYAGQPSKNLDFKDLEYQNDGIDFRCGVDNNLMPVDAKDFTAVDETTTPYENNVAVFSVNYSQQNQNIFKDITLDQSEFTETAESLQITNEIANKGAENRVTLGGQNMYDVYSVRSYSTEVEMMGNAMIQPMMYFQLNNIPMFHGAYMIIKVSHSIRPNHMLTTFKGVRIKNVETPLLEAADLYMPLLESVKLSDNSTASASASVSATQLEIPDQSVAGLFVDPFENNKQNVKVSSAPGLRSLSGRQREHKGVDYAIPQGTNLTSIYDGVIEFIKYNYDGTNNTGYGLYVVINHGVIGDKTYKTVYGHISELDKTTFGFNLSELTQENISKILSGYNPNIKVKKGQVIGKSGGDKGKSYLDVVNKKYDTAGGSTGGHLHHELRIGDANQVNTNVFSLDYVNGIPYLPLNDYAKYKDGIQPPITQGNNADYWSLVAICALEAGIPQARADVAQSIYNRLATPGQAYGKTIKNIICAPNQYQPTFGNRPDWLAINDQNTAITALKNAKNWTTEVAKNKLYETILAINDESLKQNSRNFIESRTEFLAETPSSSEAIGVVQRTPTNQNNAFFWRYAGKKLKGESTPLAINWNNVESVNIYLT
jgi:murein DD-endopeptidase MepM/ murein hydrolase activator NlpD